MVQAVAAVGKAVGKVVVNATKATAQTLQKVSSLIEKAPEFGRTLGNFCDTLEKNPQMANRILKQTQNFMEQINKSYEKTYEQQIDNDDRVR